MSTAVLRVDDKRFEAAVVDDSITFDVSGITEGLQRFDVAILSASLDTLFAGALDFRVRAPNFGVLTVPLQKRNPVLQVCPREVMVTALDSIGEFTITNRGSMALGTAADSVIWTADPSGCITTEPSDGLTIVPNSSSLLIAAAQCDQAATFPLTVAYQLGAVEVAVRYSPL